MIGVRQGLQSQGRPLVRNLIIISSIVLGALNIIQSLQLTSQMHPNAVDLAGDIDASVTSAAATATATAPVEYRSFDLAQEQSFGFFDDIDEKNWKNLQKIAAEMVDHERPDDPLNYLPADNAANKPWDKYFDWYQTNYEPNFSCAHEQRVGGNGNGDGPKWVCDPHRLPIISKKRKEKDPNSPGCVVYSIGSNCDFQFELGMQQAVGVGVCEYHTFDMGDYERCIPKELENAHYHRWGIIKQITRNTEAPQPGQRMYGLKDTMKLLGHEHLDAIDVFKIDCEGCEWTSFEDWLTPDMPRLNQIQVEVHKPPRSMATKFFDTLQAAGYVRFHKEANIQYESGGAIEYTFLRLAKEFFPKEKLVIPVVPMEQEEKKKE